MDARAPQYLGQGPLSPSSAIIEPKMITWVKAFCKARFHGQGADLREAPLANAPLMRARLRNADLTRANLSGAKLRGADLCEVNLIQARLRGANLMQADL